MQKKYLVMWNDSWMWAEKIANLSKLLSKFDAENHLDLNENSAEVVS